MAMQFELTIRLTGNSLQEIDTALMEAAGERLTSRMVQPPPTIPQAPLRTAKPAGLSFKADSDKKGRGRPPLKEGEAGKYERKPVTHVAAEPPAPKESSPSLLDEARNAVSKVNELLGFEEADGALRFFGAQKVGELPEASLADFILYCESRLQA